MEVITKDVVYKLSQEVGQSLISMYMPTHRVGREMQQDPIRLKNLLSKAKGRLESKGLRKPEIETILSPVELLLLDSHFWQHQGDGLALFVSPDDFQYYRLPTCFEELLVISERFHLKPLLPILNRNEQFYVLALSQKQIKLLHGSRYRVAEVDMEDVPTSLNQALSFDDPEKQLQFHTGTATPGGLGGRPSIFHGHGVSEDDAKTDLLRYFQMVDNGLMELLGDRQAPMVLAGVDYLLPIYQQANHYPYLVEEAIEGNPDELDDAELHLRAWNIVDPIFQADQRTAMRRFAELHGSGSGLASVDLESIIRAAHYGRVETLFVALDVQVWGEFDARGRVERHSQFQPGDHDLLDLAAMQTLLNGGTVHALEPEEMPEKAPLAAIYRYRYGE